jgi:hypothetical protein
LSGGEVFDDGGGFALRAGEEGVLVVALAALDVHGIFDVAYVVAEKEGFGFAGSALDETFRTGDGDGLSAVASAAFLHD